MLPYPRNMLELRYKFQVWPLAEVPHEGFVSREDVQWAVSAKEHVNAYLCACVCVCTHTFLWPKLRWATWNRGLQVK